MGIEKWEGMVSTAKRSMLTIAAEIAGSILVLSALTVGVNVAARERYLTPIIDARIKVKTDNLCEMVEVLYKYNLAIAAKSNETRKIWNQAIDDVKAKDEPARFHGGNE